MSIPFSDAVDNIVSHLAEVDQEYLAKQFKAITSKTLDTEEDALDSIRDVLSEWSEDALADLYSELLNKDVAIA